MNAVRPSSNAIYIAIFTASISSSLSSLAAETRPPANQLADNHPSQVEHIDQHELLNLNLSGQTQQAFKQAFDEGDELFEVLFERIDGVGANVGNGSLFSRVPRADLDGAGQWATHVPARATGPNGQSCDSCHNQPFSDGAGASNSNVVRDPLQTGAISSFISRNTPHLFGLGAIQRLAEEMTAALHRQRDKAIRRACRNQANRRQELRSKGIHFGALTVSVSGGTPCQYSINLTEVDGVDDDLIVRPFQWKGKDAFIRAFNRDAAHNELGMQSVELVGHDIDGDGDGVRNELTIGDQTGLAIYLAAQPRPVTSLELDRLGLIEPLTPEQKRRIRTGKKIFRAAQCSACHTPRLKLVDPVFSEPSQSEHYRDTLFPGGPSPIDEGVDPANAVTFDLTKDQPDNVLQTDDGRTTQFGTFATDARGRAIIELYGDLKRHDMGPELAEGIDEIGTGKATWLTKELWGVGSTAPYLHDGRATTLTEAIVAHGGEAQASQQAFQALTRSEQQSLIAFLNNLVLFKLPDE